VLERRADLEFLRRISRSSHPQYRAFRALAKKPSRLRRLIHRVSHPLPGQIGELIAELDLDHPGLFANLDAETVADWRAYLARPQYGPLAFWTALCAPPILAAILVEAKIVAPFVGAYLLALALTVGAQMVWLYGVARVRSRWWRDRAYEAPDWIALGWAPAGLVVLAAAALLPVSSAATLTLDLIAVAVAWWAYVTGRPEPDRGDLVDWAMPNYVSILTFGLFLIQPIWRPRTRLPPAARQVLTYAYLGLFWLSFLDETPTTRGDQLVFPVLACLVAFSRGEGSLTYTWMSRLSMMARRRALLGFGAAVAATPFLLRITPMGGAWAPAAAVLLSVLVLLHKAPAVQLDGRTALIRDVVMRYGGFGWVVLALLDSVRQANGTLLYGGLWMLSGVAVTVIGALWANRPVPRELRA
jgi:hypothetical protein